MARRDATPEETERVALAMLAAIEQHGDETGHDVRSFHMPADRVEPRCNTCGAVMFEGPPIGGEVN